MNLEAQYNNRANVPEHPAIIAGWSRDAAGFRASRSGEIDVAYGPGPRHRLDIFSPAQDKGGPIFLFIHGGYWRTFDKSSFSHLAAGPLALGMPVAIPSYSLCPAVTIPDIIDEMRQATLFLWQRFNRPVIAAGHSAGGHLAVCLAATDWTGYGAPAGLVPACLAISGLFDLRPLVGLAINEDLRLDRISAHQASPLLWPAPKAMLLDAIVGGAETREFLRQSDSLAAAWRGIGLEADYFEEPGENHFTVVRHLANAKSAMMARLARLIQRSRERNF